MTSRPPRRGELWSADLNPRRGTEAGKVRPVLVVQSDLLNEMDHASTWILPCTTRLSGENILRVELPQFSPAERSINGKAPRLRDAHQWAGLSLADPERRHRASR